MLKENIENPFSMLSTASLMLCPHDFPGEQALR